MFIIYALCEPKTEEIRYIGKSVNGLSRPFSHWRDKNKKRFSTYRVYRWLRKCSDAPTVKVLEECSNKEGLSAREQLWIAVYSVSGRLTNMTKGGEGTVGRLHSDETKKKLSEAKMGKPGTTRGRMLSEEHKAKLRNKNVTNETRIQCSISQKQRMQKPEELERVNNILAEVRKKRMKAIRCSDGRFFESVGEASRIMNIAKPNIIAVLKGRYKQAQGFVFEYV